MDLKIVQDNRQNFIKKAIKNKRFNLNAVAYIFEVKPQVILNDIKEIYGEDFVCENSETFTLKKAQRIKQKMMNKLKKEQSLKEDKDIVYQELGMWHPPVQAKTTETIVTNLASAVTPNAFLQELQDIGNKYLADPSPENETRFFQKAESIVPHFSEIIHLLQTGLNKSEVQKTYELTSTQTTNLGKITKMMGIEKTFDYQILSNEEVAKHFKKLLLDDINNESTIVNCTGINRASINAFRENNYSFVKKETNISKKIEERQKQAYDLYTKYGETHGYTMREIAEKLGVTRATVEKDIKAYKKAHPELIDKTQLYRPRHAGEKKYKEREDLKERISDAYKMVMEANPDLSKYQAFTIIEKHVGVGYARIDELLQETGDIPTRYDNNSEQYITDSDYYAKIGYENTTTDFHGSATTKILKEMGPMDADKKRSAHLSILAKQRKTMRYVRGEQSNKEEFEEHGSLKEVLKKNQAPYGNRENPELSMDNEEEMEMDEHESIS